MVVVAVVAMAVVMMRVSMVAVVMVAVMLGDLKDFIDGLLGDHMGGVVVMMTMMMMRMNMGRNIIVPRSTVEVHVGSTVNFGGDSLSQGGEAENSDRDDLRLHFESRLE